MLVLGIEKILQGERCDTEKAELVGEMDNGLGRGDFNYLHMELYITPKSKKFFMVGEGGANTIWSKPIGNMRSGGSGVEIVSKQDAFDFAQRNLPTKTIDIQKLVYFGIYIDDEPDGMNITVPLVLIKGENDG